MSAEQDARSEIQQWEYTVFSRYRGIKGSLGDALQAFSDKNVGIRTATEWDITNILNELQKMGNNGWELISVVNNSSIAGAEGAGFTTDELWVFKRPKQSLLPAQAKESETDIKRFSPEARRALEEKGYIIYLLHGKSLEELQNQTLQPSAYSLEQFDEWRTARFWTEITPPREVAVNPNQPFLPDSDDKGLVLHKRMLRDFSIEISEEISGTKAILGEASNHVELAILHRNATGESVFGEDRVSTITNTLYGGENKENLVEVGEDRGEITLYEYKSTKDGRPGAHLMPLVVPE